MSKIASFAVSVTATSSDEPEGNQIDFGPYITNVTGGATLTSPGVWLEVALAANANNVVSIGPYATSNVIPMYLGVLPVMQTSGALNVAGANTDAGTSVSSSNPSFIPVKVNINGDGSTLALTKVYVASTAVSPLKIFWV